MRHEPLKGSDLSLAELEAALAYKARRLRSLQRRREKALRHIERLEAEILAEQGGGTIRLRPAPGEEGADNNSQTDGMTLREAIQQVLSRNGEDYNIDAIAAGVLASGYKTKSKDFRTVVGVALRKHHRDWVQAERGLYRAK